MGLSFLSSKIWVFEVSIVGDIVDFLVLYRYIIDKSSISLIFGQFFAQTIIEGMFCVDKDRYPTYRRHIDDKSQHFRPCLQLVL